MVRNSERKLGSSGNSSWEQGEAKEPRAQKKGHGYSMLPLHRTTAGQGEGGGEDRLEYEQNFKKENQTWEEAKAKKPW